MGQIVWIHKDQNRISPAACQLGGFSVGYGSLQTHSYLGLQWRR
jgi:hypothetical protein